MNRRTLLATCASTGLTATAGCLGRFRPGSADETSDENADELEGYVRPDHEPEVRPPELECERVEDDEYERHPPRYQDIQLGGMENFSLRVTDLAFEYGDTAEITLRNDTSETKQRGPRDEFNLEVYTTEGWQDVRVWIADHPLAYPDAAFPVEPGETVSWDIELTEDGVSESSMEGIDVCPPLETGRYRFAVPLTTPGVDIAVEFDLSRDS